MKTEDDIRRETLDQALNSINKIRGIIVSEKIPPGIAERIETELIAAHYAVRVMSCWIF